MVGGQGLQNESLGPVKASTAGTKKIPRNKSNDATTHHMLMKTGQLPEGLLIHRTETVDPSGNIQTTQGATQGVARTGTKPNTRNLKKVH